jgi:glycosyltransferase involved in cell wall biosynthesis
MPRVSVICPTYNRGEAIRDTLASVRYQSITDWELMVVSDGSTDDTDDTVRVVAHEDPRVRLVRVPRCGHPSGPRNTGLRLARGAVVAYLDHDDRWRPDHLAVVLASVDGGADLVATGFERNDSAGRVLATSTPLGMHWHPEIQTLAPLFEPSRVAHRAGLPERVGGWRDGPGLEDWDLWVRLTDDGMRFTTVHEGTVRILEDQGTRLHRTIRRHRLRLAVHRDARSARRALERITDPRNCTAVTQAAHADMQAWYRRMHSDGSLVAPSGWKGVLAEQIDRAFDEGGEGGPPVVGADLVVVPCEGGYAVALPLWCATRSHAERVEAVLDQAYPRQLSVLRQMAHG